MSTPPGRTWHPAASSTTTSPSAPGVSPPIWTILPSTMIRSAAEREPAVTTSPPLITTRDTVSPRLHVGRRCLRGRAPAPAATAESVAQQGEARGGQHDHQSREDHVGPRGGHVQAGAGQDQPPLRRRGLGPDPDE